MQPILPNTPPDSRVWRILHFPIVLLAIGVGLMIAGSSLFLKILGPVVGNANKTIVAAMLAAAACGATYWAFVGFVERRPSVPELGLRNWLGELAAGLFAGLALFTIVIGIIAAFGGYRVIGSNPPGVMITMLALAIVSGVTEEILFRGLFFRILESWLGSWIALILSGALFGSVHLGNPNATVLAGAAIALEAGIMLAALYMLTRRLWAAIGLHAAWNFAQGGIFGVAVSGFEQKGLLVPRITGSDLLTGGSFGAEASLTAILVNVAFGIGLLILAHRRGHVVAPFWVRRRARQGAGLQE